MQVCSAVSLEPKAALHMQLVRSKATRPNVMASSMPSIRPSSSNWVTSQQSYVYKVGRGIWTQPHYDEGENSGLKSGQRDAMILLR